MTDDFSPKNPTDYKCDQCDYITKYRNDFKKHCATRKHLILTSDCQKTLSDKKHVCECGNEYKHRQSLFNHKKICQVVNELKAKGFIIPEKNEIPLHDHFFIRNGEKIDIWWFDEIDDYWIYDKHIRYKKSFFQNPNVKLGML